MMKDFVLLNQFGKPIRYVDANSQGCANGNEPAPILRSHKFDATYAQSNSTGDGSRDPEAHKWGTNALVWSNIVLAIAAVSGIGFSVRGLQLTRAALVSNHKSANANLREMKAQSVAAQRSADAAKSAADTAAGTLAEIIESGSDTRALADAAKTQAANSETLARNAGNQVALLGGLADAASKTAQAAFVQNQTTAEQFVASQRPWISVEVEVLNTIRYVASNNPSCIPLYTHR